MPQVEWVQRLEEMGYVGPEGYRAEAFSRNIGILTPEEQEKLLGSRVAIAGVGGVGGVHLITLVRQGVGCFHLADFDRFEAANVNRQYGARVPDFGRHKLEVMVEEALRINPYLEIKPFPQGVTYENVDDFLDGVDVVLDGLDFFNFDMRRHLFNRSREKGIYVVTAAPLGFSSAVLVFSPAKGAMTFDEYFDIREGMTREDKLLSFGLGVAPGGTHLKYLDFGRIDLNAGEGPSSIVACQLCSSMASMEAVRILLGRKGERVVPRYFQFDPYLGKFRSGRLPRGNRNPVQRAKIAFVKTFLLAKASPFRPVAPDLPRAVEDPGGKVSEEALRYILRAGIQAPSGDNVQPWKFSCAGNRVSVWLNADADHSFFNFRQIASLLSAGAVVENMRVAAGACGFEAEVSWLPDAGEPHRMAHLDLVPAPRRPGPLLDAIWKRRTNRKTYAVRPLSAALVSGIQAQAGEAGGSRLHVLADRPGILKLARLIYRADRIRNEHRGLHEYLQQMIHYDEESAIAARSGFPVGNLEAGKAGEYFLKFTRPWPIMNFMNRVGVGRMVALHAAMGVRASSAAVLVTVPATDAKDFLLAGGTMERAWLYLTRMGLVAQPMAALPLFWLRWRLEGPEAFSPKHRKLLEGVWGAWRELFPAVDFEREQPAMLLRVGYASDIRVHTLRRDVGAFMVGEGEAI